MLLAFSFDRAVETQGEMSGYVSVHTNASMARLRFVLIWLPQNISPLSNFK